MESEPNESSETGATQPLAVSSSTLLAGREKAVNAAKALVDKQAEDEGLWFDAEYCSESHLQAALRALHELVEAI